MILNFEKFQIENKLQENLEISAQFTEKIFNLYESANLAEDLALFERTELLSESIMDNFKRNPDESTGKQIVKYIISAIIIDAPFAIAKLAKPKSTARLGLGVLAYLPLAIYRRKTDTCEVKKKSRTSWYDCMMDATRKSIAFEKSSYNEVKAALIQSKIDEEKKKAKLVTLEENHLKTITKLEGILKKQQDKKDGVK